MSSSTKTVLVVDDDKDVVEVVSARLRTVGFRVETALDGTGALAAIERGRPSVMVIDIVLPDLNGFQVCRAVREKWSAEDLPIVIQSGKSEAADRYWAEQVGANAFLPKPCDLRELITTIESLLDIGK